MKEKLIRFLKQETVLCAAFVLAIVSMLFVHPDEAYIGYVDFRTLAILFCLMSVMAGLQKSGVFQCVAQALLVRVRKASQLVLILVLLCFFSSMLVTNDVALITFVPFTLVVLGMVGPEVKNRLLIPVQRLFYRKNRIGIVLLPGEYYSLHVQVGIFMGVKVPHDQVWGDVQPLPVLQTAVTADEEVVLPHGR